MSSSSQASQRINALLDENSFVEIGGLVTARNTDFNLKQEETPSDGVVTGYGVIDGNLVYVYSQDASVLGGSVGEMHARKIVRLYDLAIKTGAPVIGLIDSTGLRLQEATDALTVSAPAVQTDENGMPYIQVVTGTDQTGNKTTKNINVSYGLKTDYYVQILGEGISEGMEIVLPDMMSDKTSVSDTGDDIYMEGIY